MDAVLRAAAIYSFLLLLFRIAGKRTFQEMTPFDFVLLLVIGESTEHALLGDDRSVTHGLLLITTLVGLDVAMSLWKQRSQRVEKLLDGVPLILVAEGQLIRQHMEKERVDEVDLLESARRHHGLERLDQIRYAVLEPGGGITIIPAEETSKAAQDRMAA